MHFPEGSKVLFVGEGDFSFIVSLTEGSDYPGVQIVASCLQKDLSERAKNNSDILIDKGVQIELGVDATQLHNHNIIKHWTFTHIVFNFPHVGGKMRIDLNRKLLRDFFESSVKVLDKEGRVLVRLCAGQGGVPVDSVSRRWDDSWKVVLMASYADLVLRRLEHFDPGSYPGYSAVGYRSLEKSFGQHGALTYVFEVEQLSLGSIHDPQAMKYLELLDNRCMRIPCYLYDQLQNDLIIDKSTMLGCLFHLLVENVSTSMPCHCGNTCAYESDLDLNVLSKYIQHFPCSKSCNICFLPAYRINKNSGFQVDPMAIIFSKNEEDMDTIINLLNKITIKVINSGKPNQVNAHEKHIAMDDYVEDKIKLHETNVEEPISSNQSQSLYVINLHDLAKSVFCVEMDELWAKGQSVEQDEHIAWGTTTTTTITYTPRNLCPLEYIYDLSFWEPESDAATNSLDLDAVQVIIINTAGNILKSFELLSTYEHSLKKRRSYTYRMKYKSFYGALSDELAKNIHSGVGKQLQECLGVEVR